MQDAGGHKLAGYAVVIPKRESITRELKPAIMASVFALLAFVPGAYGAVLKRTFEIQRASASLAPNA